MQERIFNRTTLSGVGAWVLSVLPYFQEGSKMNITSWVLLVIGTIFVLWGVLNPDKHVSFNDKKIILEERQEILPKLRLSIASRLKALRPLINKAEKLPLIQYWDKYLKNTLLYLITKQKPKKPLEITNVLVRKKFPWNNLYYQELKDNDPNYKKVSDNYNIITSKIDDSVLRNRLKWLWNLEHASNSLQIYASLSMNNRRIPNVPLGYRWRYKSKNLSKEGFQGQLKYVEKRIDELMRGDDL